MYVYLCVHKKLTVAFIPPLHFSPPLRCMFHFYEIISNLQKSFKNFFAFCPADSFPDLNKHGATFYGRRKVVPL